MNNRRVTFLTPRLVRLEWHPEGRFDDRRSFVAWNREFPPLAQEVSESAGWTCLQAGSGVMVRWRGEGPFTPENLEVEYSQGNTTGYWRPGQQMTGALGGTTSTLDGTTGDPPVEPGLLSLEGWAFIDDSGTVRLGPDGWAEPGASLGQDWYLLVYGRDFRGALQDFVLLAGRPPLPPRFAMGMWWSRYWRYSEDDLKGIVAAFRQHGFPLDVLVLDMDWHLAKDWSGYTWNQELFPDPARFLAWCHDEGLRVTLNLHPSNGVQSFEADYADFATAVGHPGDGSPVPFQCSDRRFMTQYFRQLHHPLEDQGVNFWWLDWQQGDACEMPGLAPLPWLNHLHHVDHDRSDRRGVLLSRWGGLGGHRYPLQFSGDTYTKWETLASQVDFTAGSAASLAGWWSHDIGGHIEQEKSSGELFARWFQWGALSPALRLHSGRSGHSERRPWGYDDAATEEACRVASDFRLRYFPRWVALAYRFHETGISPLTPMWLDHPEEVAARTARAQAMWGDDVVIAPIVSPMENGRAERVVWLPEGEWFDWQTGECLLGNQWHIVRGALERLPVFFRAGAVAQIEPGKRPAMGALDPRHLWIECWRGNGAGECIEDAGDGDGWKRGETARTRCHQTWEGENALIVLEGTRGRFPGLPARRATTLVVRGASRPDQVVGPEGMTWDWSGREILIHLPQKLLGDSVTVRVIGARSLGGVSPVEVRDLPRTIMFPAYGRLEARRSFGAVLLFPPTGGASARVHWKVDQGDTVECLREMNALDVPTVVECPVGWDPTRGACRWKVDVHWERGGTPMPSFAAASRWDLACGLGEWAVCVRTDVRFGNPAELNPARPIPGATEWIEQSFRRLRHESLLDGPRLWCDSKLARILGHGIGNFRADGQIANQDAPTVVHMAAVTEIVSPGPQQVRFRIRGFAEALRVAFVGRQIALDEAGFTEFVEMPEGRSRLVVVMDGVDVSKTARYLRMLSVVVHGEDARPLTGIGCFLPQTSNPP